VALKVFSHLHTLSPRFHLTRQTGGISRDMERGTRAIGFLLGIALQCCPPWWRLGSVGILLLGYDLKFPVIVATFVFYAVFTVFVTEWRTIHRRAMNRMTQGQYPRHR
jgi:ATP-binding cassette subfamily B protein